MKRWVALFRGINVGGRNRLLMAQLRIDLEALKLKNVRTYIQSGNVIFDATTETASTLNKKIVARIEKQHGFRSHVLVLNLKDLQSAIASNPFPQVISDPTTLHFFFLAEPAINPDIDALENAKSLTESYTLTDHVFYLYAPDGAGRSKLAANAERYLGVVTTARNYRTVEKLLSMALQTS